MRHFTFILIYLSTLIFTLSAGKTVHHINKRITTKMALAQIKALLEVKSFMRYAKKSKPMLMMEKEPNSTNKYYCIAVGVNNFDQFRTSSLYFVDSITGKIFINDSMNVSNGDTWHLVSLQQLRRWGKSAGWEKPHIFIGGKLIVVKN